LSPETGDMLKAGGAEVVDGVSSRFANPAFLALEGSSAGASEDPTAAFGADKVR
jgi:hypothetical protein